MIGRPHRRRAVVPITVVIQWKDPPEEDARELYQQVTQEVAGTPRPSRTSDWGGGLLAHVHSVDADGRACVVEVWEDEASMQRFQERLMPVLERMGITEGMQAQVYETNNLVVA
jgi:quinol monooxygenase YgiN